MGWERAEKDSPRGDVWSGGAGEQLSVLKKLWEVCCVLCHAIWNLFLEMENRMKVLLPPPHFFFLFFSDCFSSEIFADACFVNMYTFIYRTKVLREMQFASFAMSFAV